MPALARRCYSKDADLETRCSRPLGYRLSYVPGAANGLVLSRIVNRQHQILASTGAVKLEGGKSRTVLWNRGPGGRMTVSLDGKTVISATDAGSRKAFTGFALVNTGGSYGIRSIAINGAKEP